MFKKLNIIHIKLFSFEILFICSRYKLLVYLSFSVIQVSFGNTIRPAIIIYVKQVRFMRQYL